MELFNIIYPSPLLAPFVKYYWTLEIANNTPTNERTLPTGNIQLVFHRGEQLFSSSSNSLQAKTFISGQTSGFSNVISEGNVNMFVLVFHPHAGKVFFSAPMSEFYQKDIAIDEIGDIDLSRLAKQISSTPDNETCVKLIESFLFKRLQTIKSYNFKRIYGAINEINQQNEIKINKLADITCLSYKQFNRIFAEYVGISPKEFSRIVRFQRALHILQTNTQINITQLAYECGYYDQSHLIKDFKAFSGYTPGEFLNICQPHSDYFS